MNIYDRKAAFLIIEPVSDTVCQFPVQWRPPVTNNLITCPKCGTVQEKTSNCVKCRVIFEKIAIHSRIQPPHNLLPSKKGTGIENITEPLAKEYAIS